MVAEVPVIFVFLPLLVAELHVIVYVLLSVPSVFSIQSNDTVEELENDLTGLLGFNGAEKMGKGLVLQHCTAKSWPCIVFLCRHFLNLFLNKVDKSITLCIIKCA